MNVPTILFPGSSAGLSKYADAVFFMSLLNSRDLGYVITNQVLGAPLVYRSQIEPISMAYLIVEPGGTVGWVGDAKRFPKRSLKLLRSMPLQANTLACIIHILKQDREPMPQLTLK